VNGTVLFSGTTYEKRWVNPGLSVGFMTGRS
jgi:hypothetical protein